jgi:hypothetical protein
MQAMSDGERIGRVEEKVDALDKKVDRLETKVEDVRGEARADFRLLLGVQLSMFMAMILGFAGILLQLS